MPSFRPRQEPLDGPLPGIIGASTAMKAIYRRTRLVAPSEASVLLVGETGTGKELVARAIHGLSGRADGPYIRVNCGALSESLLESELFGHVKGAFTGATENKTGRFEAAHGGTIFLDEIGSMSAKLQVKLLRVLQEREFERVGESRTITVDTRVIAATNEHLEAEIRSGRFRHDLYYRLNVVPIRLPPLRERREDVPELARYFFERYSRANHVEVPDLTSDVLDVLLHHDWPGNVRELENWIERAVVLAQGQPLTPELVNGLGLNEFPLCSGWARDEDLAHMIQQLVRLGIQTTSSDSMDLHERIVGRVERELIEQVLKACSDVQVKAAARLGINRNTLHKKLAEFAGPPPDSTGNAKVPHDWRDAAR